MWIFGYGSIIWRPAFPHTERALVRADGLARRFWQKSTDHRGVPGAPGRVVTLVDDDVEHVWGVAFHVAAADREAVLGQLDHREKGGYERRDLTVTTSEGRALEAVTWIATAANDSWWGPASIEDIARTVRSAAGPSGPNVDYVLELARALRALGATCEHTFAVERAVLKLL